MRVGGRRPRSIAPLLELSRCARSISLYDSLHENSRAAAQPVRCPRFVFVTQVPAVGCTAGTRVHARGYAMADLRSTAYVLAHETAREASAATRATMLLAIAAWRIHDAQMG